MVSSSGVWGFSAAKCSGPIPDRRAILRLAVHPMQSAERGSPFLLMRRKPGGSVAKRNRRHGAKCLNRQIARIATRPEHGHVAAHIRGRVEIGFVVIVDHGKMARGQ